MNGEPQPAGDRLDRAVFALKMIWLGLLAGGLFMTMVMVVIVASGAFPGENLGALNYVFLLPVPLGLIAAFVLVPAMVPSDPAALIRAGKGEGADLGEWQGTTPDDAYYWYPVYASRFFVRAGLLEGTAIVAAIGFLITGDWVLLGGTALMLLVLAAQAPSRAAVEAFAADARMRQVSAE